MSPIGNTVEHFESFTHKGHRCCPSSPSSNNISIIITVGLWGICGSSGTLSCSLHLELLWQILVALQVSSYHPHITTTTTNKVKLHHTILCSPALGQHQSSIPLQSSFPPSSCVLSSILSRSLSKGKRWRSSRVP